MNFNNHLYSLILCSIFIIASGSRNKGYDQTAFFTPVELQCEYRTNPLGIDIASPRLGWILKPANVTVRGQRQTAYQLLVASSPELLKKDTGDCWNSGKAASNQTNGILYAGKILKSHQTVWWKVRTWDQDNKPSDWSSDNKWTMGIVHSTDWGEAKWIGAPAQLDSAVNSTFLLRREFEVKSNLKTAIISLCGLGQYEITLNGKPITETVLNPGWTNYNKTCLYDTYNITSLLQPGRNAIGILLGNGMYKVAKGDRYAKFERSFGRLQAIAKIQFEYNDGSVTNLVTDGQWKAGHSPMVYSGIFGGEDWDARKVENNWDKAAFNELKWMPVDLLTGPGGKLKGITHAAPPIRKYETLRPVSRKEIKPGVFIYDLAQNASQIVRLIVHGEEGSMIKITPDELLMPDGSPFRNNYNGRSFSKYTLAGKGKEIYTAKFFYTACRYLQVECFPSPVNNAIPQIDSIEGIVVHSGSSYAGEFSCSNDLFNSIYTMIRWAEWGNMMSVLTDCPHRERLGWLEQDHLHGPSFRYGYDMNALMNKVINDINDSQQDDGLIPTTAPEYPVFPGKWRDAIEWGSAGVLLPWQQYRWTGDMEILKNNYQMMKRYVDYISSKAKDFIAADGLGDWSGQAASPHTPKNLVATAFYYSIAEVLSKTAMLLKNSTDTRLYSTLTRDIRDSFNKNFYHPDTKQYGSGSQTANGMALVLGLVNPVYRKDVLNNLVADIENRKYENTTGEIGMRYLLRALADGGRSDVIYKMNNQSEKPGYGYQLKMGATALPETWDADRDNSQIHFMLGHIMEWFYHDLAGIQMDTSKPGFREFIIKPNIVEDLTEVKGSYNSLQGKIVSEWKRDEKKIMVHVVVPPNTTARVYIPAQHFSVVTESGKPVSQIKGGRYMGMEGAYAIVKLGSGDYMFSSLIP